MENEKIFEVTKAEGGAFLIQITTGVVDRDKEILEPDGMVADAFLKNPVYLWCHDMFSLPVGKITGLIRNATGWAATVEFLPAEVSQFAEQVRWCYDNGFLNACSVRFAPIETTNGDGTEFWRRYVKWELLEVSAVTVPANAEALAIRAKALGDAGERFAKIASAVNEMAAKQADGRKPAGDTPAKAGAILSRRNATKLQKALGHIAEVLTTAGHAAEYCPDQGEEPDEGDDDQKALGSVGGTPAAAADGAKSKTDTPAKSADQDVVDLGPEALASLIKTEIEATINRLKGVVQ